MQDNEINIASLTSYQVYPAKLGGQKNIVLFYDYLSKLMPVTMICTKNNQPENAERIHFIMALDNSKLRYIDLFLFFSIRRIIKKNRISHLILEHPYYGWLGILLKRFTKAKLIVRSQNIESLRFKSIGKWWWGILWHYEKITHRCADHNFFIQDDDKDYTIQKFKLTPAKCTTITYGFELNAPPGNDSKQSARDFICNRHQINKGDNILLFNGGLHYKPNLDALDIILETINPLLLKSTGFAYKIIICGSKLPEKYKALSDYKDRNILYAGFVDDITVYFKGADIFINPVNDGGGIKTKLVESLGYDLSVVSTRSGAIGVPVAITGEKLKVCADDNWEDFALQVTTIKKDASIPMAFFDHFYWGNIAVKAVETIKQLSK